MSSFSHAAARPLLCGLLAWGAAYSAQSANNVASPNILWHNKGTGQNRVWLMSGANFSSEITLPATSDDLGWQMVGSGDFDQDGNPDIVWQNQNTGQNAVWFMKGTIQTAATLLQSAGDMNWKLVGVADFNGDGLPDLLWQNLVTAQNAVWLMRGVNATSYNLIVSNGDPNWRIVATGDFNGDGKADIILRNQSTGQNAVWYMNGLNMISGELLHSASGVEVNEMDADWKIVGAGDYNSDGKLDLLWRHCTLGLEACWFLNGGLVLGSAYLNKQDFNTDWRNCSQDMADSTWRLQTASYTWLRAKVASSPPQVVLNFTLVPNSGFGATVQRRLLSSTNWTTLATGFQASTYSDNTVATGNRYEYKVFREQFGGAQYSSAEHVNVAVNAPPIENRGKVILLVDNTLTNQLAANLAQLTTDLVGDGWTVVRYDVPRHVDDYSSKTSYSVNANNITNVIKPLIRSAYNADPANANAIFIIGHVAIPYSGMFSVDGHTCGPAPYGPDHQGAWVADMFYGDLDGTWTDTAVNYTNCYFAEPLNVPGDGKFDQDQLPSPFVMRLAVGRVDFARMPVFTSNPTQSEVALLQQYLLKDHKYRSKLLNWQSGTPPTSSIVYGDFHDSRDYPIFENAAAAMVAITTDTNSLVVGDFCLQRNKSYVWGMMSGPGICDRVNQSYTYLEHSSADLTISGNEPTSTFYMLLASFMGDWNLTTNNYLRALIATPNYGLASMWTRHALWRIDAMGTGEHLGACELRMTNDPKDSFYDRSRELAIMGDPTLRLHILTPPANVSAVASNGSVQVSWSGSEPGAQFYVYRSASAYGPYTRISSAVVSGTSFTDSSPSSGQKVYMVRALKPVTVGNGTYTNISQGAIGTSN
jgi:hypothetical protein